MSFEQPTYSRTFSHPGGEPPTPTRTPTSPDFFSNSYQTPTQDSKFRDPLSPWTPALGFSPIFKSQACEAYVPPSNDPLASPAPKALVALGDVESEAASHAQHPSLNLSIPLAPVETSQELTSCPPVRHSFDPQNGDPTLRSGITPSRLSFDKGASESMNSAGSIQTPPPTSTSTSRRKVSESQAARSRALAPNGVTMSTPLDSNTENATIIDQQNEESPSTHFPNLQFSPDGLSFPGSIGPATAPVYPQHKLFWDPEQSADTMNLDFSMDDSFTNFGLGLQKQLEPYVSDHDQSTGMPFPSAPAFTVPVSSHVNIASLTAPAQSVALNQTNTSRSTAIMTHGSSRGKIAGTVVNPSLLFSSPSQVHLSKSQSVQNDTLKPYAHQLQDAMYEKEIRSRGPKRKRGVELDSPAVTAATQALRAAEDESSLDSADGTIISSFSGPGRPMSRSSRKAASHPKPASKGQGNQHGSTELGRRTSVTLTIDENGRAKTETKLLDNRRRSIPNEMETDNDSSNSESTSSRSSREIVFSRPSSFSYPSERIKQPRVAKSHGVHDGRSAHSHHSSYASNLGSANANTKSSQIGFDHRRVPQHQVHFEDTNSFISGTLAGEDSEAETVVDTDDDKGNAASALKKVVRQRSNQKLRKNSLPRQSFADHRMPPTGSFQPSYNQNISPTTITDPDLATPSTGGRSAVSTRSVTRCVCNVKEGDGQLMVQCDSCKHWLHLKCVGLNPHNIPEIYLCIFCNHETPKNRGVRREPAKATFPPPGSPLAYKSNHYR